MHPSGASIVIEPLHHTTPPSGLVNTTDGIVTDSGMVGGTPAASYRPFYLQLSDPSPKCTQLAPSSLKRENNEAFQPISVRPVPPSYIQIDVQ